MLITANTPPSLKTGVKEGADTASRIFFMPLSLLYLSGALAPHFEVKVLDLNALKLWRQPAEKMDELVEAAVAKELDEARPFLVGVNCQFSAQIGQTIKIADLVKKHRPESAVATGGLHPTIFHDDILRNCPSIDFVLKAEGEESIVQLARAVKNGTGFDQVDGLTWRGPDGRIVDQPKNCYIEDPDTIPRPAYQLFDFNDYQLDTSGWHNPKGQEIGVSPPILTSRSCPNRCNFCVMFRVMGSRFRPRSAGHVLDEIEFLHREYGSRYFNIMDDNFTLSKKRTLEICRGIIDRKLDIQLRAAGGLSLNALDDETIDALAEAGLIWAPIAIESGSDYIRNQVMGKRLKRERIFDIVKSFRRYPQILLVALFIMGMPEDTEETLMETYRLIEELDIDDANIATATPFPGTALFEQCRKENLLINYDGGWNKWNLFSSQKDGDFFIQPRNMSLDSLARFEKEFRDLRVRKMSPAFRSLR